MQSAVETVPPSVVENEGSREAVVTPITEVVSDVSGTETPCAAENATAPVAVKATRTKHQFAKVWFQAVDVTNERESFSTAEAEAFLEQHESEIATAMCKAGMEYVKAELAKLPPEEKKPEGAVRVARAARTGSGSGGTGGNVPAVDDKIVSGFKF